MKVFISWSGRRSKAMATALKDWLPLILQYVDPWVSDKDIGAGDRWAQAIAGELEASNFGLLCITPENISSPWILFEAGALSKSMQDAKVIPLLFGLELSDLSGPLSQFQAIKVDQQGMLDVAKAINGVADTKTAQATIEQLVPALWMQLEGKLNGIPEKGDAEKHMRPQTEILEDLVSQVRGLGSRMRDADAEQENLERSLRYRPGRLGVLDPRILEDLMQTVSSRSHGDISFLILAGFVRDTMPWLAEAIVEARREFKTSSEEQARLIGRELMHLVEISTHGPLAETIKRSKSDQFLLKEIPFLLERAISQQIEVIDAKSRPRARGVIGHGVIKDF